MLLAVESAESETGADALPLALGSTEGEADVVESPLSVAAAELHSLVDAMGVVEGSIVAVPPGDVERVCVRSALPVPLALLLPHIEKLAEIEAEDEAIGEAVAVTVEGLVDVPSRDGEEGAVGDSEGVAIIESVGAAVRALVGVENGVTVRLPVGAELPLPLPLLLPQPLGEALSNDVADAEADGVSERLREGWPLMEALAEEVPSSVTALLPVGGELPHEVLEETGEGVSFGVTVRLPVGKEVPQAVLEGRGEDDPLADENCEDAPVREAGALRTGDAVRAEETV